jgi:hypothetical protein
MQLVPLPTDGRVTAIDSASLAPGPLRVVLEPHDDGVGVVSLGPGTLGSWAALPRARRPAYSPVLRQLRTRGLTGTCRAWAAGSGALALDLAPAHDCAERVPARAVPAAAPSKPAARSIAPKPAPTTVAPAAQPKPTPKPTPKPPPSGCDPNYSGCVPIAKDVDCEGGSGDGPAYVKGPVRVIGKDIYGLDKGGQPGIGCE